MVDNLRRTTVRSPSVMRTLPSLELARDEPSTGLDVLALCATIR